MFQDTPARSRMFYGKLSRFLARNVATKKLTMRNVVPLVSFTFDDALASAVSVGASLLERKRARGTFYISAGGCGSAGPCGQLATPDQVKAIFAKGHEIGCHTYSHAGVTGISRDQLVSELRRNQFCLQNIDRGMITNNFAYPYGELSFRTKHLLEARFDSCRSLTPGVNVGTADLGALKACMLQNTTIDTQGIEKVIRETVRYRGWLIFVSHDVADDPSCFGVTPNLLAFALRAAQSAGCNVATVRDALRSVRGIVAAN